MTLRYEEPGWMRIGNYDDVRRRALWVRYMPPVVEDEMPSPIETIELCSGREGDDDYVKLDASNPQFAALREVLTSAIVADEKQRESLQADNARLRALIGGHEWTAEHSGEWWCLFCDWPERNSVHRPDCPAFTPDGQVK